jgi:aldose 1-epimerase
MLELRAGANRVLVDPDRGGRLASWSVDGRELLVGPPTDDDRSIRWGCFLMAPWPGRLAGGRFDWRGRTVQVRRTHGRHAIHGLLWHRAWSVDDAQADHAGLSIELPRDEWPMGGRVRQRVSVTPTGLRLEAEIEAAEPMPAALGWHPWFLRSGDPRLRVDADRVLVTRGMIPTGATEAVRGRTDLRTGPRLGDRRLDLAYLAASSPVTSTWPDLELRIEFTPTPAPLVVYTPPESFCVEPLTAAPNALALPLAQMRRAGVHLLAAGERVAASMTLSWNQD